MVSNLPLSIGEAEVRELLEPFGEIQAFNFIKVNAGSSSGGAAVLEYVDKTLTDEAVKGLNGLQLGGSKLSVQRVPAQMAAMLLVPPTPSSSGAGGTGVGSVVSAGSAASSPDPLLTHPPTCVLRLSNMTTMEDLQDDDAYDELQEDVGDECNNYGTVKAIVIPRPLEGSPAKQNEMRGVGMIFVSFTSPEGATRSKAAVHGRTFNGQKVVAVFYPEDLFEKKEYSLPDGYGEDNTVDDDDLN
ncbi:U2af50 [Symbiodinium microadriaticum]|nr:U2af50 [Symbiodinium microadriaticum]